MKKVVLFDFFGVISTEIAPIWFRKHFDDDTADRIKAEIVALADVGIISEEETYQRISDRMGIPPEQIAREWQELICINEKLVEFIKKIKEHYPVYLLSNAIAPFLERILAEHQLSPLFDRVFISSHMKIAKPDPEFFNTVLSAIGASAEDAVMIDDNPSNIQGAAAAGVDGILFTSNEPFKVEFDKYFNTQNIEL